MTQRVHAQSAIRHIISHRVQVGASVAVATTLTVETVLLAAYHSINAWSVHPLPAPSALRLQLSVLEVVCALSATITLQWLAIPAPISSLGAFNVSWDHALDATPRYSLSILLVFVFA